ncbi:Hemerythrin HHE cation binding domain-containing protein [Friedmanniella luteola]|uniref:Hemerythrin HHE cation binding domain-containing protein n=1 Tax=Friedmanniella luteola TaxID=546871 RepID=A0A1H1MRN3_9ACTN|nr:hemerythrin domain-containing protein [Friedmanniella luteola]SDR89357.1 Hemerythrin HHE cation binding domain-containing protein [Friedmanniella luteola]
MTTTTTTGGDVPQASFPGQAAAPPGPADLMPMYLMHHAFRRDLAAFTAAVAATPLDDRRAWRRLDRRWGRFARVLHLHHAGEDEILWPLLLTEVDRAGDVSGRATLEAMEAEHGEIDPLLSGCAAGLHHLTSGGDADTRAALVVRMAAARERLGHHLGHEESDAMALVQRHLTPAEWDALHPEFGRHYTPRDGLFALPWVLHDLPVDLRPRALAFVGRGPALVWTLLLRVPFALRERRTFRAARRERSGG